MVFLKTIMNLKQKQVIYSNIIYERKYNLFQVQMYRSSERVKSWSKKFSSRDHIPLKINPSKKYLEENPSILHWICWDENFMANITYVNRGRIIWLHAITTEAQNATTTKNYAATTNLLGVP